MNIKSATNSLSNFFFKKLDKSLVFRIIFLLITLISLMMKSIYFLSSSLNKNVYDFNFAMGYSAAKPFLSYYIAFIGIFLSFTFLFKGKGRYIYLIIINIFLSLIISVDVWYFRGFFTVPSALIVTQTANLDNMSSSILSMTSNYDLLFLIDFVILVIFLVFFRKHFKKAKTNLIVFLIFFISCVAYVSYTPFCKAVFNKETNDSWLYSNYDPTDTTKFFSPIGYHIIDLITIYKDSRPYNLTSNDKDGIKQFYDLKNENLPQNEYSGIFKGKNLIVLQVESLENFVVGQKVDGQEITPNLNKLLSNSLYFPNIFEQVNEGTSSDSDLMVNTSVHPITKGSTFFRYATQEFNSMPKLLEHNGYETSAYHPDKGSFWNVGNALKGGIGFKNFYDAHDYNQDEIIGLGLSDKSFLTQVSDKIKDQKSPFYSFVVTLTSHGPFDLPEEYRDLKISGELSQNVMGDYFQAVHYTDKQIGMFIEKLDKDGVLDNTVVAIVGDHTGVHKYYNDKVNTLSNPEDWYLDNGNHTVPFIIYQKGLATPKKFDNFGGQVDLMPTLLYSLGIDKDSYQNTAMGRPLLNTNRSFAIVKNEIKGDNPFNAQESKDYLNIISLSEKMIKSNYFKEFTPSNK